MLKLEGVGSNPKQKFSNRIWNELLSWYQSEARGCGSETEMATLGLWKGKMADENSGILIHFKMKGKWEEWFSVLDPVFPFCRNSVVPLENICAVPKHIGSGEALQSSLGTAVSCCWQDRAWTSVASSSCCSLHRRQTLGLLMRQGWQLKNPDAKLWTGLLFGLWLAPSLASALALQQPLPVCRAGLRIRLLLLS